MPRKDRVTKKDILDDRNEAVMTASQIEPAVVGNILVESPSEKVSLHRMLKQLRLDHEEAAAALGPAEARYLVDLYYQMQEFRKSAANRRRAGSLDAAGQAAARTAREDAGTLRQRRADEEIDEEEPGPEPNRIMEWVALEFQAIESHVKRLMGAYANNSVAGAWAMSLVGIGPVLAGGLVAHIDITKAPTAGSLWRFAGFDPTHDWHGRKAADALVQEIMGSRKAVTPKEVETAAARWHLRPETVLAFAEKDVNGEPRLLTRTNLAASLARRPHNAKLKTLCWKMADCAKKFSGRADCYYGGLYRSYKARLMEKNEAGEFAAQAAEVLQDKPQHAQRTIYAENKLPPGHLDARAMRWVAKMFLSHYHEVAYRAHYGKNARVPYVLEHVPGHSHRIEVPNSPFAGLWTTA